MKTYGFYHAVVRDGKKNWKTVATIPAYGESCLAGAESFFDFLGIKYHSVKNRAVENQKNWNGKLNSCLDFNISFATYNFINDLQFAQRQKNSLVRTLNYSSKLDSQTIKEILSRQCENIEGFEIYLY